MSSWQPSQFMIPVELAFPGVHRMFLSSPICPEWGIWNIWLNVNFFFLTTFPMCGQVSSGQNWYAPYGMSSLLLSQLGLYNQWENPSRRIITISGPLAVVVCFGSLECSTDSLQIWLLLGFTFSERPIPTPPYSLVMCCRSEIKIGCLPVLYYSQP